MGKPTYLVLLNLLVATLVAAEEGENCPFKKLVKCKRLDSQDSQFPPTEVTMVKGSASVAYTCNSEIRFKKLNLDRLSYKDVCETFYYDFDGDYLRMSMKPIKESKHNTIISAEHTEKGIWQVNTEAQLHRVGRVRMRIQFDIGREKLMVPTMFRRQLTEEYQERKKITFIFREAGSKRPSFIMAMFPDKIEYHDDDTWIFGRAAMELFKLSFTRVGTSTFNIQIGPRETKTKRKCVRGTVIPCGRSQQLRRKEPHQSTVTPRSCWADCFGGRTTATTTHTSRSYFIYSGSGSGGGCDTGNDCCCGCDTGNDCCCGCDTGNDCCCGCDQVTECCSVFFEDITCDVDLEEACKCACSTFCCLLKCLCEGDDCDF